MTLRLWIKQIKQFILTVSRLICQASGNLVDVETVMESWINQKGFPLISILRNKVQKKDGKLSFIANQKRFLKDFTTAKLENDQSKE